jgi:prepilin-type N-terminal cleavage/methylation domain-containing protein/prepilin-type processing-associated H-X9-DG protein
MKMTRFSRSVSQRKKRSNAFTLVELLVVIAIIGVVVGLTLPAVQAAREAARRMQCANNLRQMGIASANHMIAMRTLPAGCLISKKGLPDYQRLFWSGQLLPYMEQMTLYYSIDPDQAWDSHAGNIQALKTQIPNFRCPSSAAPDFYDQIVEDRATCTYLGCASGTVRNETGPGPLINGLIQDGTLYTNSRTRDRDFIDGMSNTILVAESLFLPGVSGPDHNRNPQIIDHWYIGSPGIGESEMSETLGSTAIPINSWMRGSNVFIEDIELGFSSRHTGLIQAVFADGHVQTISDSIETRAWSSMGTRADADTFEFDN